MPDAAVPIERLLAHRAWVRAVARALSRGAEAGADDLEQETWLAALESPPRHDGSLRGWLGGVLRRKSAMTHRGSARRERRELAAARPEGGALAAGDIVAEAESHARVAQAVVALPEPERTAILLRFFEGLPPREVARRTGVPVETARSRIKRALALLREALGGDDESRGALALVLGPLVRPRAAKVGAGAAAVVATGGIAMTLASKVTAAALVLAAIAAAWWSVCETTTPGGARTIATATESASPPTPPPAAAHPRVRAAADAATSPATAPAAPTKPATRIVRWRVVAGEAPTPASGSVLAVERDRGAIGLPRGLTTVRVDGDDLVAEGIGAGTIQGFAVAPDGSRAKLFALNADERGADTKFLKERRIVVTIVESDTSPAVGVPLQHRNQGNIAIRSDVRTDAAGRAEFAGLSPMEGRLDVHMGVGEHAFLSRWLGTYRLRDEATGATSAETDLTEDGAESPVVVLDLSRAGPIRGRVEVDGGEMRDARVIVEGVPDFVHTGDPKRRTVLPAADGSFETWVPGDRPLHLHAEHPLLRPGGAADVTGPTDGVVLRLVPGPTISFRVPGVALKEAYRAMTVRFFRGEPSGEAAFTKSNVVSEDDRYRVGGIDAGTWTVWIDVPERAPKILRGFVLGDESIDLGDVVPDAGLSLHVKVATFPNEVPARVGVSVSGRDGMKLFRFTSSHGESDVVVKGLVPGTYDVFVYPQSGSFPSDMTDAADPPFLRRTVVVDASNETTIDYSPR